MPRSLLAVVLLLASIAFAQGPTSTITGQIQTATGGAVANGTFTFTLSQAAIVSGTATLATSPASCYTSNQGNVVGIPDPIVRPILSTNTVSGTLPAGTYYVKIFYTASGGLVSAVSPEATVVLTSQGTVIVSPPVLQPTSATGYSVAISSTTGTETIQGTVVGFASQYQQNVPLIAGGAPPSVNTSTCKVYFSDQLVPTGTYYTVSLTNKNGTPIAGYPQSWCTYGGAGATINVSQGTPSGNCNVSGVYYPTPIFANSQNSTAQSINTALNVNGNLASPGNGTLGIVNGAYNAASCTLSPAPSWCSGSDIGAWVNAAINAGAMRVTIPAGSYNQSTTIMLPRNVLLSCGQAFSTQITFTPSSGWAVIATDTFGGGILGGRGGIEDCTFYGQSNLASYANQNGGLYLGGSDGTTGGTGSATVAGCTVTGTGFNTSWPTWQPIIINGVTQLIANVASGTSLTLVPTGSGSTCNATNGTWYVTGSPSTGVDPSGQYGDNYVFNRVRWWSFGVAVQHGNRSWLQNFHQCTFAMNGTAVWVPSTLGGLSGENVSFVGGVIGNNGQGLVIARGTAPTDTDLHFFGVSFDYNTGWQIANGDTNATVNLTSDHIESTVQWAVSYGQLYVSDSYFTNGTSSGTLGYLIDNENSQSSITNTVLAGGGSGTIFNASGQLITLLGVQSTTGGAAVGMATGGTAGVLYTDIVPQLQVIGQAKNGFPTEGMGLAWNLGTTGESDLVTNHGGGAGGWFFYDCSGTCTSPTLVASINQAGVVRGNAGVAAGASGSTISDTRELIQSAHSCGTTSTCANTTNQSNRMIFGTIALAAGTATITGISPTFTSTATMFCWGTDITATNAVKVLPASSSSITITGTGTDSVTYACIGN